MFRRCAAAVTRSSDWPPIFSAPSRSPPFRNSSLGSVPSAPTRGCAPPPRMRSHPVMNNSRSFSRFSHLARVLAIAGLGALGLLVAPPGAAAQSTAAVSGTVTGADGRPVPSALITIENTSTGFRANALANDRGQFNARQLPLGGPYRIRAESLGYQAVQQEGFELNMGDRIRVDFELPTAAVALEGVTVLTDRTREIATRRVAATSIRGDAIEALPAQGRDFSDLASLDPTFIRTGGRNLSIAGQRGTQTEFLIDGMSTRRSLSGGSSGQGAYTLSMAAIREFEVTRNEYDVTYGRSGGGVNAVTRSGTNELSGQLFAFHKNDRLTTEDFQGRRPDDFRQTQFGFGIGGPVVRDRVHFFVAYDQQLESTPFVNGDIRNGDDEVNFRVSADSLSRLLDILQTNYGLQDRDRQFGTFTRAPLNQAIFGRLDAQISNRHALTFRTNLTRWQDPEFRGGDQQLTLLEAKEGSRSMELAGLLSLRSSLTPTLTNEAKLQVVRLARFNEPNTDIPRGFVRIRSDLPNGTTGDTRVHFGGNRLSPSEHREVQVQLANTSYLQLGNQLVTFGTDNMLTLSRSQESNNQGGLFEFESLADLEAMDPFRFTRQAPVEGRFNFATPRALWMGLFAQTELEVNDALTVQGGVRWDVQTFLNQPQRNPMAEEVFGLRTDRFPEADLSGFQPRLTVTWDPRRDGTRLLQAGGGAFRAQTLNWTTVNAYLGTGNQFADITFQGENVPYPDFNRFRQDQSAVPGIPSGGEAQAAPQFLNVIGEGYRLPMIWKANVAYRHDLGWASMGVNVMASRTSGNYAYVDRNLVENPAFTLPDGRPVLVPASSIGSNGRPSVNNARINRDFGRVFELVDAGKSENRALVLDALVPLGGGAMVSASYTLNETRDNLSFNCCNPVINNPVAGDHRDLQALTASDYDFRHKVVAFGQLPEYWGFRLSARYEGQSGTPFSLMTGSDITGDGQGNNNLAFVFDPADPNTPAEVAAAMERVLANPDNLAADYIRASLGQIAPRNGGRNLWGNRLDVRASRFFPTVAGHRAEVVVDVFNFANLLNSDWGANRNLGSRQTLLNITGFDQERQDYVYSVNENVGTTGLSGRPWEIQLGVRYHF
ncbi:MAG: TonB-dependent receptor [Gemmatimonadales bacterium]|nr:MAG: TonB-dependent receptor [Gemmatimonadales bacterium]